MFCESNFIFIFLASKRCCSGTKKYPINYIVTRSPLGNPIRILFLVLDIYISFFSFHCSSSFNAGKNAFEVHLGLVM